MSQARIVRVRVPVSVILAATHEAERLSAAAGFDIDASTLLSQAVTVGFRAITTPRVTGLAETTPANDSGVVR